MQSGGLATRTENEKRISKTIHKIGIKFQTQIRTVMVSFTTEIAYQILSCSLGACDCFLYLFLLLFCRSKLSVSLSRARNSFSLLGVKCVLSSFCLIVFFGYSKNHHQSSFFQFSAAAACCVAGACTVDQQYHRAMRGVGRNDGVWR
jgi:hypothetical protein